MEKSKSKKGMPVFIGVAAVWMGTHFGPGVASGTQLNQYYVMFGLPGIFVTVIAMAFLGYALYCSMEFSRLYHAYDYQSWVEKLFGNKYVVILFDISFLVTILTAASGSMNAVAVPAREQLRHQLLDRRRHSHRLRNAAVRLRRQARTRRFVLHDVHSHRHSARHHDPARRERRRRPVRLHCEPGHQP